VSVPVSPKGVDSIHLLLNNSSCWTLAVSKYLPLNLIREVTWKYYTWIVAIIHRAILDIHKIEVRQSWTVAAMLKRNIDEDAACRSHHCNNHGKAAARRHVLVAHILEKEVQLVVDRRPMIVLEKDQAEVGADVRGQTSMVRDDEVGDRLRGLEVFRDVLVHSRGSVEFKYAHVRKIIIQNKHPAMEKAANKIGNGIVEIIQEAEVDVEISCHLKKKERTLMFSLVIVHLNLCIPRLQIIKRIPDYNWMLSLLLIKVPV